MAFLCSAEIGGFEELGFEETGFFGLSLSICGDNLVIQDLFSFKSHLWSLLVLNGGHGHGAPLKGLPLGQQCSVHLDLAQFL